MFSPFFVFWGYGRIKHVHIYLYKFQYGPSLLLCWKKKKKKSTKAYKIPVASTPHPFGRHQVAFIHERERKLSKLI